MIIVSPLRRALETAYYTFKDHPNFKNITVVLDPDLRELMNCSGCIPGAINDLIDEFKDKFSELDTTLLDPESDRAKIWYLDNSSDIDR
jgi:broad specificity phosphatase PhoE